MTFKESIITCIQYKYANFKGRASRSEYLWFILFNISLNLISSFLDYKFFGSSKGIIHLVASLALILPWLAVTARRLHDFGWSGWWIPVGVFCIPFVFGSAAGVYAFFHYGPGLDQDTVSASVTPLVSAAVSIIIISIAILIGLIKPHGSQNKYGETVT